MKRTIRYGVFETNSSSVHTLQISKDGMEPSALKIHKSDGKIHVPLKDWSKSDKHYTSQIDKLSYICTRAWWADHKYENDVNNEDHNYAICHIEKAICDYTGANGIHLYIPKGVEPGFDHQTMPEYADDMNGFCDIWNEESVQNFVFNRYISFITDHD